MKVGYKLSILFLILLVSISVVNAAVIYGGKVYSGDKFVSNIGGKFVVTGTNSYKVFNNETNNDEIYYARLVFRSDVDETVTVRNSSCTTTLVYKYCYKSSAVDFTNPKTFDDDGDILAGMSITIESLPNPTSIITFLRDTKITSYCGVYIPMNITVTNAGTLSTNITYSEILPLNTFIVNSDEATVDSNVITFYSMLPINTTKVYTYTLANLDCEAKSFNAKYSFTTYNSTISKNITNISISVNKHYNFTEFLSKNRTNSLDDEMIYFWNITNTHLSLDANIKSIIILPRGLTVKEASTELRLVNNTYVYTGILSPNSKASLYLKFNANSYGNATLFNDGTITVSDHNIYYTSNKTIQTIFPEVKLLLDVDTSVNNSLKVLLRVKNSDLNTKYYYLYGVLKGVVNDEPLYSNFIEPDTNTIIANRTYNVSNINLAGVSIIFDGLYRDKDTIEHKLYAIKTFDSDGKVIIVKDDNDTVNITATTTDNITIPIVPVINASSSTSEVEKETVHITRTDLLSRIIVGLNNFLQAVFG